MECDVRSMPRPHMERCTPQQRTHQSACARTLCPEHRSSIATRVALVEWGWRRWSDARPPLQNIMAHTHQKIHPRWILSHRMRSGHWHRDRRLGLTQTPPQVPPRQPEGIPPRSLPGWASVPHLGGIHLGIHLGIRLAGPFLPHTQSLGLAPFLGLGLGTRRVSDWPISRSGLHPWVEGSTLRLDHLGRVLVHAAGAAAERGGDATGDAHAATELGVGRALESVTHEQGLLGVEFLGDRVAAWKEVEASQVERLLHELVLLLDHCLPRPNVQEGLHATLRKVLAAHVPVRLCLAEE
mmetsp:Transcript_21831/g.49194  ORF Transcript_21831/g.49194 Transcript_21831/m.49194 type:complete len:296 (+) Transcript_21831:698-1585(+)